MSWLIDENKMVKVLRLSIASRVSGVCWSFAEFTVFGEIRLLTLSSRQDALPVSPACLVGSRGGVRTVL